jgi:hypothetical protein
MGCLRKNPEYHEGTYIQDTDDLRHFLAELMYRLKDSEDYADYLEPKFESVYELLDELSDFEREL